MTSVDACWGDQVSGGRVLPRAAPAESGGGLAARWPLLGTRRGTEDLRSTHGDLVCERGVDVVH
jgi:hypothetical protein